MSDGCSVVEINILSGEGIGRNDDIAFAKKMEKIPFKFHYISEGKYPF